MAIRSTNCLYLPLLLLSSATLLAVTPGSSHAQGQMASAAPMSAELQAAKANLAKYSDVYAAVKDGYFSTVACVDFPNGVEDGPVKYPPGAMGVHFLNPANIGPVLDPAKPQVLIYEPDANGKLTLAAAEWLMPVPLAAGKAPVIFGQTLVGPMPGHQPIMPAELVHYDLHVWLWKDNPRGMFVSTNKAVKCDPKGPYTVAEMGHHHQ